MKLASFVALFALGCMPAVDAAVSERFAAVPVIAEPTRAETELSRRIYACAMRQGHYIRSLLRVWKEHPECMALAWNSNEHGVRPNAHTAAGLGILARFGPFDAAIVGGK